MSTLCAPLLNYLVNSLWQVPLLFAAAWLATRLLRSAGALLEHRVWVGALLLQSTLPAVPAGVFGVLQTFSLRRSAPPTPGAVHVSVFFGPATSAHLLRLPAALLGGLLTAYLFVLAYGLARFTWSARQAARLRREGLPLPLTREQKEVWQSLSARATAPAALGASAAVFSPVTLGLRRPLILLPLGLVETLAPRELESILAHEFAHIARKDFLKNLLYHLLALPIRYHPFLWLTRARLVESREMVADGIASRIAGSQGYARSLLRLASLLLYGSTGPHPHAIGIFDAHSFERRLMRLTEPHPETPRLRRIVLVAICSALGLAACGSALALRLTVAAPAKNSSPPATASGSATRVEGGVMAGQILTHVNPNYPEAARAARIQGTVILDAVIGKTGDIENLRVISGPEELRASTLDAVRQWVYKPFRLNGQVTEVETTIHVNYSLQP